MFRNEECRFTRLVELLGVYYFVWEDVMGQMMRPSISMPTDFFWAEVWPGCNLDCRQCYNSGMCKGKTEGMMGNKQWKGLISEAVELDARAAQYTGGEPLLNQGICDLIDHGRKSGLSVIEVYSNLTRLTQEHLDCFKANGIWVATSFYDYRSEVHDQVTRVPGSQVATLDGIRRCLEAGLPVRAGIIKVVAGQKPRKTRKFLLDMGVYEAVIDNERPFGPGNEPCLKGLCGQCWQGKVCISPFGDVSPCIMSKPFSAGIPNVKTGLADILYGNALFGVREQIYQEAWLPRMGMGGGPKCAPECNCVPKDCRPKCAPSACCAAPSSCAPK